MGRHTNPMTKINKDTKRPQYTTQYAMTEMLAMERVREAQEEGGDAIPAAYLYLRALTISDYGVIRPDYTGADVDAKVSEIIGKDMMETRRIVEILLRYELIQRVGDVYIIPEVVLRLGTPLTDDSLRHKWDTVKKQQYESIANVEAMLGESTRLKPEGLPKRTAQIMVGEPPVDLSGVEYDDDIMGELS